MASYHVKPPLGSQLRRTDPLAKGLVGAWILNEGGAGRTAYNGAGGKATNGTLNGALAWGNGAYGKLLSGFAGGATTTTYIDCTNSPTLNPAGGLTLAALVYPTAFNTENWVIGRDDNTLGRSYSFGFGNGALVWLQINGLGTIAGPVSASTWISLNAWNLILATGDPANGWRYWVFSPVKQGLMASAAWSAPNGTTGATCLGRRTYAANQNGMVGSLGVALIWNQGLSATAVYALAADPFRMFRRRWLPIPLKATAAAPTGTKFRRALTRRVGSRGAV